MRVRAGLAIAFFIVGCGGSDEQTVVPDEDTGVDDTGAAVDDTGATDTGATVEDTLVEDAAIEAGDAAEDGGADTAAADTAVADTIAADTMTAETTAADTFVADTIAADTTAADTFVADTFVADTSVADVGLDTGADATAGCTMCHGDATRADPAPPRGTKGETATTTRAVGAHQAHLVTSTWHRDIACTECHVVPTSLGHANGTVELTWGPLAKQGTTPVWTSSTVTCSAVYCHGSTLKGPGAGGTVSRSPVWTTVDGTYDACGTTCHTNPPGSGHPNNTSCQNCHAPSISAYNPTTKAVTWANRSLHVNGVVDR